MSETFETLYAPLLKEVFREQARKELERSEGSEQRSVEERSLGLARGYAEQGKPEFALAFLFLCDASEEMKRDIFAQAYERRAELSEEKAAKFDLQFRRPFPLIKLEAQKDRIAARAIREGKAVRISSTKRPPLGG